MAQKQFKNQFPYEVRGTSFCEKAKKHIIEIKISGKVQGISCYAEEVANDEQFLSSFPPLDIRTIIYFATCDRYEAVIHNNKPIKTYEVIRSKNVNGNKTVRLRHTTTNQSKVISLVDVVDQEIIDELNSQDAYYIGYLAGQEQTWRDYMRFKSIRDIKGLNE